MRSGVMGYIDRGYDPRTLRNWQHSFSSSRATATSGSEAWPNRSRKKMYSQAFFLYGRDSILERLMPRLAKGSSMRQRIPGSSLTENMTEVLSLPERSVPLRAITKKRVKLLTWSSILLRTVLRSYREPASSLAMAAAV